MSCGSTFSRLNVGELDVFPTKIIRDPGLSRSAWHPTLSMSRG